MVFADFTDNIRKKFAECADFAERKIVCDNNFEITVLYIINLCDKKYVTESVLKPVSITNSQKITQDSVTKTLAALPLAECANEEDAVKKILSGNAVITINFNSAYRAYAVDSKSEDGRSISEPESEAVVRGPRQGFVESAEANVTLLRKIIKSASLKVIDFTFGKNTATSVKVMYYDGIVRKDVLKRLIDKLNNVKMPSCVDSGYLEQLLQSKEFYLFSEVGNSEKPDKIASKILGGRIAIICDGSPVVLTVPYLFTESIQSAEDYLKNIYYASFIRLLRFFGMIIAVFLPSIYIAMLEFHKGALPFSLYKLQSVARNDVPFDLFTETLVVLIIFEIVREVGVRMPKAVGDALSVVGGLILGDAAIKAGLTSETVVVIAALTGICNFMNPTYMNVNVLLRFVNLFLAKAFGFFGISAGFLTLLAILCSKKSFGVPYMFPFAPSSNQILTDTIIMQPNFAAENEQTEILKKD